MGFEYVISTILAIPVSILTTHRWLQNAIRYVMEDVMDRPP